MNQLDIGEFDIDGISVGIGISEEVIAARFPSEGCTVAEEEMFLDISIFDAWILQLFAVLPDNLSQT